MACSQPSKMPGVTGATSLVPALVFALRQILAMRLKMRLFGSSPAENVMVHRIPLRHDMMHTADIAMPYSQLQKPEHGSR